MGLVLHQVVLVMIVLVPVVHRAHGMMNIGIRPTVDGQKKVIEVNIFNFDQDIYEQFITVMVYEFIRGEVKFDGLDALKNQLGQDKITTSAILAKYEINLD